MAALFSLKEYKGKRVCVALSGGADSVCLLHNFYCNAADYQITISALTCEHGIRGEASFADLRFVQELCKEWNVPLFVYRKDVPAFAAQNKMGLEEAGRAFRHACFDEVLKCGKADILATAHHKDDYAETILFRLARGTSLAGMKVFSEKYARPLINVTRAQIEEYLKEYSLPHAEDESNLDTSYTRNLLRHKVLPLLEEGVAGARDNLVAFACRAAKDEEYLQELALRALPKEGEPRIACDLPEPVFYRAALLALKRCSIERDYTQALLDEIADLRDLQNGRKICLPQGFIAVKERGQIVFCRECAQDMQFVFACGTFSFGDYTITVGEGEREEGLRLDLDKLPADCLIRTRHEGDSFQPYMGGTKPLKKYLTDKKIPAREGHALPVIAKDNTVYAVFGVEISDAVKVTKETKRRGYLLCRKNI